MKTRISIGLSTFLLIITIGSNSSFSQSITNVGTEFWIAFPPNYLFIYPTEDLRILVSSDFATNGSVYSDYPGVNQTFTVVPGVVTEIPLPSEVELQGGIENKAIRITSAEPISVYGLSREQFSTDAFMAIQTNALGSYYRIVSYKTGNTFSALSRFCIVATEDSTFLRIFNSWTNTISYDTLDQGQVFLSEGLPTTSHDVTGSLIESNHPVAVFGSNDCVYIPDETCQACEHIIEQMFPYYSWGTEFVTVPLAGRDNSGDIFRVVADNDGTNISINGVNTTTINSGEYYETNLSGYNSISTSNPTMVAQFAKGLQCSGGTIGDPFMILLPPREQFLTSYTIINLPNFSSNWVNVVAPDYALGTIYQDGVLIPNSAFVPIPLSTFWGAQRSVTSGTHTFTSEYPFGVFVYGWNYADSYGYPGGCSFAQIVNVYSITLTPDTSYGQLNVTNVCLTASVKDSLNSPVEGALVEFHISGVNPLTGNAYTDSLGNAQYCYTQAGSTPGTDYVYAQVSLNTSDSVVVIWTIEPPCSSPLDGGEIGASQNVCEGASADTLINLISPTGYSGTLEYKWQLSTTDSISGFSDIPGTNFATYNPGAQTQTSWYKRLARVDCKPDWSEAVESNVVKLNLLPVHPVNIVIFSSFNDTCEGIPVTFSAQTVNGGESPSFQWQVNGINSGTNDSVFTYNPAQDDIVSCTLLSSDTICVTNNPATSNDILMTVYPNLPVSISISTIENPVCEGTTSIFSASTINKGSQPAFQWFLNGSPVGSNDSTYTYTPSDGDQVYCILTSSEQCTTTNPTISDTITMVANPLVPVGISISASNNPVCEGSPVSFAAIPINGGTMPAYQWQVNGTNAGTNNSDFTYTPVNGDVVTCTLTSNAECVSNNPTTSNSITMSVGEAPDVSFAVCFDTVTTLNAKPFKLKGGIPLGGAYSGTGVESVVSGGSVIHYYFYPAVAGTGTHEITYTYINSAGCKDSATLFVFNFPFSIFNCGDSLTDIRDNRKYPTIQIGSQCWLAVNLNYGQQIGGSSAQRDNCLVEKYCYNDLPVNCTQSGALYQWDELMRYEDVEEIQGLCPPGWHVPSETDWSQLFAVYQGNAFAGSPLLYSGYSGFNVLLAGVEFFNQSHRFADFASIMWSSTSHGPYKAWSHGLNEYNYSVSYYPSYRANAFSVRCIQE